MFEVPILTTERFTLRPLRCADAAALLPTLADPAHCLYLSRPAFASEEELWGWLAEPGWPGRTWIAVDRRDGADWVADWGGRVAGRFVAVPDAEDERVFEIGTITCAHRQREGVARECASALIEQLWREGARRLTAEIDTRNTASLRLFEALGFAHRSTLQAAEITHSGPCDLAFYELDPPHAAKA